MKWQILAARLDAPETKTLSRMAQALASMEIVIDGDAFLDSDDVCDLIERLVEGVRDD